MSVRVGQGLVPLPFPGNPAHNYERGLTMDDIAQRGWDWSHAVLKNITDKHAFDIAACAVLVAYRAGLREGLGNPFEVEYSDSDITAQIARFEAGLGVTA